MVLSRLGLQFALALAYSQKAFSSPSYLGSRQTTGGVQIVLPSPSNDTGIKQIPDAEHYFAAPGPNDMRGPCPGLNTMANHGYLPRSGIVSVENIINGAQAAFNMDYTLATALASFGMLARGNAFIDRISIGLNSPLVPPLPGMIDGPIARGLAAHGRFEGDVSMTRLDAAVGDNIHFNPGLYAELLAVVELFGDNSNVTGPRSIVNTKVMQEFKFERFLEDQLQNPELEYHVGRFLLSYGEAAFTLNFFANGTDGTLSVPTMTSFFQDQTFPANWHRRSSPGTLSLIGASAVTILSTHPLAPGANAPNGTYIQDGTGLGICNLYENLAGDNLPAVLVTNTTGLLRQNVMTLLAGIAAAFPQCTPVPPNGPPNV